VARLAAAVQADLQRGVPHEVRVKALRALGALPGHRLEALLADGGVLERLVSARCARGVAGCLSVAEGWNSFEEILASMGRAAAALGFRPCGLQQPRLLGRPLPWRQVSGQQLHCPAGTHTAACSRLASGLPPQFSNLRSSNDAVRAAAIDAAAELTARERGLQMAAGSPALLSALIDLWEGITDALTGGCIARVPRRAVLHPLASSRSLRGTGITRNRVNMHLRTRKCAPPLPPPSFTQTRLTWCAPAHAAPCRRSSWWMSRRRRRCRPPPPPCCPA
jgi:hypothetical protein